MSFWILCWLRLLYKEDYLLLFTVNIFLENWGGVVCLKHQPYHYKFGIGSLPQILLGPFFNTLAKTYIKTVFFHLGRVATIKVERIIRPYSCWRKKTFIFWWRLVWSIVTPISIYYCHSEFIFVVFLNAFCKRISYCLTILWSVNTTCEVFVEQIS